MPENLLVPERSSALGRWRDTHQRILQTKWQLREGLKVPRGSQRVEEEGYTLVVLEHGRSQEGTDQRVVPPALKKYFPFECFNAVQSLVFEGVMGGRGSILLCSPTGSGKSEVGVLAILKEQIEKRGRARVIYLAPVKALIFEITQKLAKRLPFLVTVSDTTDDVGGIDYEKVSIVVTTPERYDVLSSKGKVSPTLVIVDEIHGLNDARGGVLESVILRSMDRKDTRILGMSATIPNYQDVAQFIGASPSNTFYFGPEYRERVCYKIYGMKGVGVQAVSMQGPGSMPGFGSMSLDILEKTVIKDFNETRTLIFVSTKEETASLAKRLGSAIARHHPQTTKRLQDLAAYIDQAIARTSPASELPRTARDVEALKCFREEALAPGSWLGRGIAVHHSGVPGAVRRVTEELLGNGVLTLVCATTTLAWGVNLPVDRVVVYGTRTFKEAAGWSEYTLGEMVQMAGRAGRRGLSASAEAVIITDSMNTVAYTRIASFQFPVESFLSLSFTTRIFFEVGSGRDSVKKLREWFTRTFAYLRAQMHLELTAIHTSPEVLVVAALEELVSLKVLVSLEEPLRVTALGRAAFVYYMDPKSIFDIDRVLDLATEANIELDGGDILLIASTASDFKTLKKEKPTLSAQDLPYPIKTASAVTALIEKVSPINYGVSVSAQLHLLSRGRAYVPEDGSHKRDTPGATTEAQTPISSLPRVLWAIVSIACTKLHPSVYAAHDLARALETGSWRYSQKREDISGITVEVSIQNKQPNTKPTILPLSAISTSIFRAQHTQTPHPETITFTIHNPQKQDFFITLVSSRAHSLHLALHSSKAQIRVPAELDAQPSNFTLTIDRFRAFATPRLVHVLSQNEPSIQKLC
ncbi:pre-mRNA-splicing helicase BRR2 [Nematocida displodere]|uniref:Pre-mRNA-splicing helicase BRR2 n=1 Tax=Nematocida displodere TaxID=1805483 RepID=A0A177EDT6_9MICR|nr:pre-mRNA-splicing helicase BRR2 [Nematocida displodere]